MDSSKDILFFIITNEYWYHSTIFDCLFVFQILIHPYQSIYLSIYLEPSQWGLKYSVDG